MTLRTILLGVAALAAGALQAKTITLLNVSYDPTREFYAEYNDAFARHWKAATGDDVVVQMSHGGSAAQARSVIDGLEADVVTLALAADIDSLHANGDLVPANWQSLLPDNSCPYTSTIVFLVRHGNPKGIHGWDDLVRSGVSVIVANPKTSGGARWAFLAAWGYAERQHHSEDEARAFVTKLYRNVPVLDSGARGATVTFAQRRIGDVLISWENEALLACREFPDEQLQVVAPAESILAEPPVAVVTAVADAHGTAAVARAYLQYLYSDEGQTIAARNFYRPRNPAILARFAAQFPHVRRFTLKEEFGGWPEVQQKYFSDGGVFDQIEQQ